MPSSFGASFRAPVSRNSILHTRDDDYDDDDDDENDPDFATSARLSSAASSSASSSDGDDADDEANQQDDGHEQRPTEEAGIPTWAAVVPESLHVEHDGTLCCLFDDALTLRDAGASPPARRDSVSVLRVEPLPADLVARRSGKMRPSHGERGGEDGRDEYEGDMSMRHGMMK